MATDGQTRVSRRKFLKYLAWGAGALLVTDVAFERRWIQVTRPEIIIPGLPLTLDGLTMCQITDIHHGPFVSIEYVRRIVDLANSLKPDIIVLTGDHVYRSSEYTGPVWAELARLQAPLGVYSALGNHDHWEGITRSRAAQAQAGVPELLNTNAPVELAWPCRARLWLAGVGDLWEDEQKLDQALAGVPPDEPAILLSHNPDYADDLNDPRVKLILAGHSHGGQVVIPWLGPVTTPCRRKYAMGLVKTDASQVYISRGLGVIAPPVRINCRPELPLITLRCTRGASSEATSGPPARL